MGMVNRHFSAPILDSSTREAPPEKGVFGSPICLSPTALFIRMRLVISYCATKKATAERCSAVALISYPTSAINQAFEGCSAAGAATTCKPGTVIPVILTRVYFWRWPV